MKNIMMVVVALALFAGAGVFFRELSRLSGRIAALERSVAARPFISPAAIAQLERRLDALEEQLALVQSEAAARKLLDPRSIRDLPTDAGGRR